MGLAQRDWFTQFMTLRMIGYWRNDRHPELPHPADMVDQTWDVDERDVVASYFETGTFLRGMMGLSPCRICGQPNGSSEFTDGVLAWPEGLAHYLRNHGVRLPISIERYVVGALEWLDEVKVSPDWWAEGAPPPTAASGLPLEPLRRLAWAGNVQLVRDPTRKFPQLLVAGDTLALHVDGPKSGQLKGWYEQLMSAAGCEQLPYD